MSELKLGKLLTGNEERDALHVAIAPVIAQCNLKPGDHVGLVVEDDYETVGPTDKPVGIIDPFLSKPVKAGQRCWLFLYPNTVTSLRHEWIHPEFPTGPVGAARPPSSASIAWLTAYARHFELSYEGLIEAITEYNEGGRDYCLGFDTPDEARAQASEMWLHYAIVTGNPVRDSAAGIFRCAC